MKNLEHALNPILQNLYLRYEDCIVENKLYPTTMEIKIMLKAKNIIPLFSLLFLMQGNAQSDINAGISFGPEGLKSFYLSVSEYYRVPEQQVVVFRERKITVLKRRAIEKIDKVNLSMIVFKIKGYDYNILKQWIAKTEAELSELIKDIETTAEE